MQNTFQGAREALCKVQNTFRGAREALCKVQNTFRGAGEALCKVQNTFRGAREGLCKVQNTFHSSWDTGLQRAGRVKSSSSYVSLRAERLPRCSDLARQDAERIGERCAARSARCRAFAMLGRRAASCRRGRNYDSPRVASARDCHTCV